VSLLGILDKPIELDLNAAMIFKSATVFGITGRRMFETWYQVRGLLAKPSFKEKISTVITHRIPIRDISKGMELIGSKQAAKIVLEPKW
jgi:threonine 3-dehydrogenase